MDAFDFTEWNDWDVPLALTWQGKDKSYPIPEMTDSHITNCIALMNRKKQDCDFWIAVFEDELKKRER